MMKQIAVLVVFLIFISCGKSENPEVIPTDPKENEVPPGNLLFTIEIPDNSVRKTVDKIHFVLYDGNDAVLDYKTHSSGQAESLKFYSESPLEDSANYSLSRISNFQESVFTIRLYKDLTGAQLKNGIQFRANSTDRHTNILDLPITSLEEGHYATSQGSGYSFITTDGNLSGHFSSDYTNGLGSENILIRYLEEDGISNHKYRFIRSDSLSGLSVLDTMTFTDEESRYRNVNFYNPFTRTLIKIFGYEDESKFEAGNAHTVHASNNLSDYGGVRYSYANIFHKYLSTVQSENYEIYQVGLPSEDLIVPELSVDYSYSEGLISFTGIPEYEASRFLLRASTSNEIHVTTEIVANGSSTEISIPEVPADLFAGAVAEGLKVSKLSLQQGAAENYEGYETYSDYLSNTLLIDKPYYLSAPKRERIFKSSVSSQLLPF